MTKSTFQLISVALTLCSLPLAGGEVDIVVNGSFEEPDISRSPGFDVFLEIPGWRTISGSGIEIQDHCCGGPSHLEQHVELDSFDNTTMEQVVHTVPGETYVLKFGYVRRIHLNLT